MVRIRTVSVLGAVLLLGAVGAFVADRLTGDSDPAATVNGFHRLPLGAGGEIVQLGSGTWVGYYEAPGPVTAAGDVPNFRAFIRDDRNAQVNVGNAAKPIRYAYGGKNGLAILQFDAPQSGRYRIVLQGVGTPPPGADLAIGRDLSGDEADESGVSLALVLELVAGAAGIGLLGWAVVQRSRRRHVVSGAS